MKTSYLNYIDQFEKIIASVKNLDLDDEILDLYGQLSHPNTKSQTISLLQKIVDKIKASKIAKENLILLDDTFKNFAKEITGDKRFDDVNQITAAEPDDDDDEEEQDEEKPKSSQKSDIDDIFDEPDDKDIKEFENVESIEDDL